MWVKPFPAIIELSRFAALCRSNGILRSLVDFLASSNPSIFSNPDFGRNDLNTGPKNSPDSTPLYTSGPLYRGVGGNTAPRGPPNFFTARPTFLRGHISRYPQPFAAFRFFSLDVSWSMGFSKGLLASKFDARASRNLSPHLQHGLAQK